jgi:hypothetical protein
MSPHSGAIGTTSQHEYAVNAQPFAGKVIAITGASRGLGLALTKYLLARGAIVSMCATSETNLANAVSEISDLNFPNVKDRYMTSIVDISNLSTVKTWIDATVAKFGKLDGPETTPVPIPHSPNHQSSASSTNITGKVKNSAKSSPSHIPIPNTSPTCSTSMSWAHSTVSKKR